MPSGSDFCGIALPESPVQAQPQETGLLTPSQQSELILKFMKWQDAGATPLPLLYRQKHPGEGWRQRVSPSAEEFSDLVRSQQAQGIGVPLRESDVVIDIEGRARGKLPLVVEAAELSGLLPLLERAFQGLTEETPSGGLHIHLQLLDCLPSRKQIIARRPKTDDANKNEILVESLGFGQQVVVAPSGGSTHPTGRSYREVHGDPSTAAPVTSSELADLFAIFRVLDETPITEATGAKANQRPETLVERDFNLRMTWEDVLEPYGWRKTRVVRGLKITVQHWVRPGKKIDTSATTVGGALCVFSTAADLPAFQLPRELGGRGTGSLKKFDAFAILNHGGDRQAALHAAFREGFGRSLPPHPLNNDSALPREVAFLAECLASAIKGGPKSKGEVRDIALRVVPGDVLLRIANRERRATGQSPLRGFGKAHAQSLRWACEKVSRQAIQRLVQAGKADFRSGSRILRKKEF
jgi:hypothetical protein